MDEKTVLELLLEKHEQEVKNPPAEWGRTVVKNFQSMPGVFLRALKNANISDELAGVLLERKSLLPDMVEYWFKQRDTDVGLDNIALTTTMFLEEEWLAHRHGILCERLADEYEVFRGELLELPKEDIIDKAFQINARDDIVMLFDTHRFELPDIETLLTAENPLEEIYLEWRDYDGSGIDELMTCVDHIISRTRAQDKGNRERSAAEPNTPPRVLALRLQAEQEYMQFLLETSPYRNNARWKQAYEAVSSQVFDDPLDVEVLFTYNHPLAAIVREMGRESTSAEWGIKFAIENRRIALQAFQDSFEELPNFLQPAFRQFHENCAFTIGQPVNEPIPYDKYDAQPENGMDDRDVDDELEQ